MPNKPRKQKSKALAKTHKAEIIETKEETFERLARIEEALRADSFELVHDVMQFADIAPDEPDIPPDWITQYGFPTALKKFRLAKAGWLGAKEAPVAIKVAASICGNIIKARATEITKQPLNMTLVQVNANIKKYDVQEIDDE